MTIMLKVGMVLQNDFDRDKFSSAPYMQYIPLEQVQD